MGGRLNVALGKHFKEVVRINGDFYLRISV